MKKPRSNSQFAIYPLLALCIALFAIGIVRSQQPGFALPGVMPDEIYHFGAVLTIARVFGLDFVHSAFPSGVPVDIVAYDDPRTLFYLGSGYDTSIITYLTYLAVQAVVPLQTLAERWLLARYTGVGIGAALAVVAYFSTIPAVKDKRIALALAALLSLTPSVASATAGVRVEPSAILAAVYMFGAIGRLYRKGWSVHTIVGLFIGVVLCLTTRDHVWMMIPVALLMILRRSVSTKLFVLAGVLFTAITVAAMLSQLRPVGAAHWYRNYYPWDARAELAQVDAGQARWGRQSIYVQNNQARPIWQYLSGVSLTGADTKVLTVGAWVRAAAGTTVYLPELQQVTNKGSYHFNGHLTTTSTATTTATGNWQFENYTVIMQPVTTHLRLVLPGSPNKSETVFYDGVVVTAGDFSGAPPPQFDDEWARTGVWGGRPFGNLVQNGSAESQWRSFPPDWSRPARSLDQLAFAMQDLKRTWPGYVLASRAVFVTLWGSFQGENPGLQRWQYGVIGLLLLVGAIGWLRYALRRFSRKPTLTHWVPRWAIEMWGLWLILALLMDFARTDVSGAWLTLLFYATGRFILHALYPVIGLTVTGWGFLIDQQRLRSVLAATVVAMALLNLWMLLAVEIPYYRCPVEPLWTCVPIG